ncbi:MAG: sugar phosphate isomerase/epimerase, partial [Lachnospiraceae bacterium]|nr:sugar phosphate isomerase/epimerase [Lachnospiraceae bacterium]
ENGTIEGAEIVLKLLDDTNGFIEGCHKEKVGTSVAYAPHLKCDTKRIDLDEVLLKCAMQNISVCKEAGCQYIIIEPLSVGISNEMEWRKNQKFYLDLAEAAKEKNIMILLKNQCKNMNGHLVRGVCSDGQEAARWVDCLNQEAGADVFGFCVDVGVCNLCGQDMQEYISVLGDRIKAVILRDNDGMSDSFMLPFTSASYYQSRTDWLSVIRGLRGIGFDGYLILNFADTAAVFSPILRPQLMQLAKSVADYFKWQIEIENLLKKYSKIVLFGAGNMCRNYMKCYGEKYPPLFTCDNNPNMWGKEFCGLEIKSPEVLKEISSDCAIFICNVYYREIEKQLRTMGINNPIEFFNDEYMPSFHYDRI